MDLQIFNYAGKEIRTVQKDSEVWWVLKKVTGKGQVFFINKICRASIK